MIFPNLSLEPTGISMPQNSAFRPVAQFAVGLDGKKGNEAC